MLFAFCLCSKLFKLGKHHPRTFYYPETVWNLNRELKKENREATEQKKKYRFSWHTLDCMCGSSGSRGYKYPTSKLPCESDSVASCVCGLMSASSIEMEWRKGHFEPSQSANNLWWSHRQINLETANGWQLRSERNTLLYWSYTHTRWAGWKLKALH